MLFFSDTFNFRSNKNPSGVPQGGWGLNLDPGMSDGWRGKWGKSGIGGAGPHVRAGAQPGRASQALSMFKGRRREWRQQRLGQKIEGELQVEDREWRGSREARRGGDSRRSI